VLVQLHILVHCGDALLESGLEGRNLVPYLVLLVFIRVLVVQDLLQLLDAVLRVLAVFRELLNFAPTFESMFALVEVLFYLAQLLLVLRCVYHFIDEPDRQDRRLAPLKLNFYRHGDGRLSVGGHIN
jgi:hypothetical protein